MTHTSDLAAVIDAGRLTAEPYQLQPGTYNVIATRDSVHEVDLTDLHLAAPRRTVRQVQVDDVGSFVDYWDKHSGPDSEVYADRRHLAVRAIIDAPGNQQPAWGQHVLTLQLRHSEPWKAWAGKDRTYMRQAEFAEHIEDHLGDITTPPGAEMLEVAQTLHAHTKVSFTSGYRLVDGQRQLQYVEETTGAAGPKGALQIPTEFHLALPVFHGNNVGDQLRARLRYRIEDRKLLLGYALDGAAAAVDEAFSDVVNQVADGVGEGWPIFHGSAS